MSTTEGKQEVVAGVAMSQRQDTKDLSDLRELVIQAGLELLERDGLRLDTNSITYSKVFAYLEEEYSVRVTRGSVHERIWKTQEHFCLDTLAKALEFLPNDDQHPTTKEYEQLLPWPDECSHPVDLDGSSRRLGPQILQRALESPLLRYRQAIKTMAIEPRAPHAGDHLRQQFRDQARDALVGRRALFRKICRTVDYEPRSELGLTDDEVSDLFHILRTVLIDGAMIEQRAGFEDLSQPIEFMSVSADEANPWLVVSVGLLAHTNLLLRQRGDSTESVTTEAVPTPPGFDIPDLQVTEGRTEPRRRSRDQLKELVLAAAVELLLRDGLQLRSTCLTYAAVFAHIRRQHGIAVHRASVHNRFWSCIEEFQLEVLSRATDASALRPLPDTRWDGEATLATTTEKVSSGTVSERQLAAHDLIRKFTDAQMTVMAGSRTARSRLLIKGMLQSNKESPSTEMLRTAVDRATRHRLDYFQGSLQANILDLGFEVRPELGITEDQALHILKTLIMGAATGLFFNYYSGDRTVGRRYRLTRPDHGDHRDEWNPLGLAVRAYVEQLYRLT